MGLGAHLLGVGVALTIGVLPAERCIFCSIHHGVLVSAGAVRSHSDLGVGRGAFDLMCRAGLISRKHCCLVLGNSLLVGATHAVSIHVGRAIGRGAHLLGVDVALAIGVLPAELVRIFFCMVHGVLVSAGAVSIHLHLGVGLGAFDLVGLVGNISHNAASLVLVDRQDATG